MNSPHSDDSRDSIKWGDWQFVPSPTQAAEQSFCIVDSNDGSGVKIDIPSDELSCITDRAHHYSDYHIQQQLTELAYKETPLSYDEISQILNHCSESGYGDYSYASFSHARLLCNDTAAAIRIFQSATSPNKILTWACLEDGYELIPLCLQYDANNVEENIALLLCRDGQESKFPVSLLTKKFHWSPNKALDIVLRWAQYDQSNTTFVTRCNSFNGRSDGKLLYIQYAIDTLMNVYGAFIAPAKPTPMPISYVEQRIWFRLGERELAKRPLLVSPEEVLFNLLLHDRWDSPKVRFLIGVHGAELSKVVSRLMHREGADSKTLKEQYCNFIHNNPDLYS